MKKLFLLFSASLISLTCFANIEESTFAQTSSQRPLMARANSLTLSECLHLPEAQFIQKFRPDGVFGERTYNVRYAVNKRINDLIDEGTTLAGAWTACYRRIMGTD